MLSIFFGERPEPALYGPSWFKYSYDPEWFQDPFVREMISDVDHSTYVDGLVIDSPVLGAIPPERLSGGVQTLIMIYECPDKVFDATSCGPNCAKWLMRIGSLKDIEVNLQYFMPFESEELFNIRIVNNDQEYHDAEAFAYTALEYL